MKNDIARTVIATIIGLVFQKLFRKQYNSITIRKSPNVARINPSERIDAIAISIIKIATKIIK